MTAPTYEPLLRVPDVDLGVKQPADNRVLVATAAVALLFDMAMRAGVVGVAGALTVAAAAIALVGARRTSTQQASVIALCAIPFGAALALRTSDWLTAPNILAAAGLLTLAAVLRDGRSVFDLGIAQLLIRTAVAGFHFIAAPGFLLTPEVRQRKPSTAVIRGLILAAPVLIVLGVLLASADAVFASLFSIPADAGDIALHAVLLVAGGWGMAGLLRTASADPPATASPATATADHDTDDATAQPKLGRTEANVILGGLTALFSVFALTQVVTALGGADHVLENQGLTYAEYARSGFFQLLAVAAITMVTLLAIRATARLDKTTLVLAECAVALILIIVGVALYRLDLYEAAYGLTMLRLYCQVFAVWIAITFTLLGAALLTQGRWLPAMAAATGLAILLMLNLVNPEALVVKRNVKRAKLDTAYLEHLSDDAAPALARANLAHLVECKPDQPRGWAAANLSRSRANTVRNRNNLCQP